MTKTRQDRKTITRAELCGMPNERLDNIKGCVELDGKRLRWVGFSWINEGAPRGDELLVTDA